MNCRSCLSAKGDRRAERRRNRVAGWVLLGWVFLADRAAAAPAVGGADPAVAESPAVAGQVLGVPRSPDADQWFLRDAGRQSGRVRNEVFRLRTVHGLLEWPAGGVAALDFTDRRGGLDVVVTEHGDRLSGFLEDATLRLEAGGEEGVAAVRRERLLKIVFKRPAARSVGAARGTWVRLRNGDFFTGTVDGLRFTRLDDGREWPWTGAPGDGAEFSERGDDRVQLTRDGGAAVEGRAMVEEVEFRLGAGGALTVHRGWIAELRGFGHVPEALGALLGTIGARSVGAVPDSGPGMVVGEDLVWVRAGEFVMGSGPEEKDRDLDEGPVTRVVIPAGFWMGRHEVTQTEFEALMGSHASQHLGDGRRPVERVSWHEAMDYCARRTARERAAGRLPDGYAYRLPTEAEWEYACRAGTTTRFSHGDDPSLNLLRDHAWFSGNSGSMTHPGGLKQRNPWGFYDLSGNVLEWCLDDWRGQLPGGVVTNRAVLPEGDLRVARGGSWLYEGRFCRAANRDSYGAGNRCSDVGFRVVLAGVSP